MAFVNKLRAELMGDLGFEVESHHQSARPNRGETRTRIRRRRQVDPIEAVSIPHPRTLPRQQHRQQQQYCGQVEDDNRMVDWKHARPQSAKLSRVPSCDGRGRPASASSARHSAGSSHVEGGVCSASRDMEVLLEICRDQGRANSLNPADFDSSISAIANLPVKEFMGAAKLGWGPYFRNLHDKMRREGGASSTTTKTKRPPLERRRRLRQRPAEREQPLPRAVSSKSARALTQPNISRQGDKVAGISKLRRGIHSTNKSNGDESAEMSLTQQRKRRGRGEGGKNDVLAGARARAAKREEEESVTRRMANRLQALWQELKIPDPDRAYVMAVYLEGQSGVGGRDDRGGLFRTSSRAGVGRGGAATGTVGDQRDGSPTSDDVHHELARQILLLLEHRSATVKVLRSVSTRESRLTEVEQALQAFRWHRGRDTDAVGLVDALRGLRQTSLDVIRAIVEWRTNLWQPRAFCWQGVNYLEKMTRDTGFLRSSAGETMLASVGLNVEEMAFIVFPPARGVCASSSETGHYFDVRSECGSEGSDEGAKAKGELVRPPPAIVRLTPNAQLASEYRARFFDRPSPGDMRGAEDEGSRAARRQGGTGVGNAGRRRTEAGAYEGEAADAAAAANMQAVVVQEAALQRRVEAERLRLATKGCFVPLLRWLPGDRGTVSRKGKRRRPSSASPATPSPSADADQAPADETKTNDRSPDGSNDGTGVGCGDINDGTVNTKGGVSGTAEIPSRRPSRGVLPPPFPSQLDGPPLSAVKVPPDETQLQKSAASSESCAKDYENELGELRHERPERFSKQGEDEGSRPNYSDGVASYLSRRSGPQAESPKGEQISTEGSGEFADGSIGQNERMNREGSVPLDTSHHVGDELQPQGTEEGTANERETSRQKDQDDGDEVGTRGDVRVGSTAHEAASHCHEAMAGMKDGDDGEEMVTSLSSRVPKRREGDGGEGDQSEAPSVGYDDDFEEDAQGYSLSYSDGDGDGATVGQHNDVQSRSSTRDPDDGKSACDVEDAQLEETQLAGGRGSPAGRGLDTSGRAQDVIPDSEQSGDGGVDRIDEPKKRSTEDQLVAEREHAAATAASQIQRSARAWLHHRSRSGNEKSNPEEGRKSAEREKQDWLDDWRARRHSQVKQAQDQPQGREEPAVRIQAAVRGRLASKRVTEMRRDSDARKRAAATKIQALVRLRVRHTAKKSLVESAGMSEDLSRTQSIAYEPVGASQDERTLVSNAPVSDLEAAAATITRVALTIQRAVQRANSRETFSSEMTDGAADVSSSTMQSDRRATPEVDERQETDEEERRKEAGGGRDRGSVVRPDFASSEIFPSSLEGDDNRDEATMDEGNHERQQQRQPIPEEVAVGPSSSLPASPLPSRPPSRDGSAAVDAPGDDVQLDTETFTDTSADKLADTMMTTVVSPRPGVRAFPSGSSAVGLSSVPECRPLVSVVASASEYGSDDLNFDALSSSTGGSGSGSGRSGSSGSGGSRDGNSSRSSSSSDFSGSGSSSGMGSGSGSGSSFGSSFTSGSRSRSRSGEGTQTKANSLSAATAAPAEPVLIGMNSPDIVDGNEDRQLTEAHEGEGIGAGAADSHLPENKHGVDAVAATNVALKDMGPELALEMGGVSGGSSLASLSVSSSSS